MKAKTKNMTLLTYIPIVSSVFVIVHGGRLSHVVNGMSQPPKKSAIISELEVMMLAYSASGRFFFVDRPSGDGHAVPARRADGQREEEADRQVGHDHINEADAGH